MSGIAINTAVVDGDVLLLHEVTQIIAYTLTFWNLKIKCMWQTFGEKGGGERPLPLSVDRTLCAKYTV